MNTVEFFRSNDVALPKRRDDNDFARYLSNIFAPYLEAIDHLDSSSSLSAGIKQKKDTITQLMEYILAAVESRLQGQLVEARDRLRSGLSLAQPYMTSLLSLPLNSTKAGVMYRMRLDAPRNPKRADLFHVPFQLGHKIGSYRYSIAGVPCLYLGGSLRACWLELDGRKQLHDRKRVTVCQLRCRGNRELRVLNFAYRPSVMAGLVRIYEPAATLDPKFAHITTGYAVCWPLLAASSITRMRRKDPFAPEHMIPKVLIEWAREEYAQHGWNGIRYFSTRIAPKLEGDALDDVVLQTANFAFPTLTSLASGYCTRLLDTFVMSEPTSMYVTQPATQLLAMETHLSRLPDSAFSDIS